MKWKYEHRLYATPFIHWVKIARVDSALSMVWWVNFNFPTWSVRTRPFDWMIDE
jgi:hypothetical protein